MMKAKANEKQKSMYDTVMLQARSMIFTDYGIQAIVERIKGFSSPEEGIAYTAAMMMRSIKGGYAKKGKVVPPEILAAAFKETVGDLIEVAVAAKLVHEDDKGEAAKNALHMGAIFYKKAKPTKGGAPQQPQGQPQGLVQSAMGAA